MEQKKINLEDLFEDIRNLSETFETDEADSDIFLVSPSEINSFSEELNKIMRNFIKNRVATDDNLIEEELSEDDDDLFLLYGGDDLD